MLGKTNDLTNLLITESNINSTLLIVCSCFSVAQAYLNQKRLDAEAKQLHISATNFAKQTSQWMNLIEGFSSALKVWVSSTIHIGSTRIHRKCFHCFSVAGNRRRRKLGDKYWEWHDRDKWNAEHCIQTNEREHDVVSIPIPLYQIDSPCNWSMNKSICLS